MRYSVRDVRAALGFRTAFLIAATISFALSTGFILYVSPGLIRQGYPTTHELVVLCPLLAVCVVFFKKYIYSNFDDAGNKIRQQ